MTPGTDGKTIKSDESSKNKQSRLSLRDESYKLIRQKDIHTQEKWCSKKRPLGIPLPLRTNLYRRVVRMILEYRLKGCNKTPHMDSDQTEAIPH